MSSLPRSAPSAQQVSGARIVAFLDAVDAEADLELHSVMILRHGAVVAETWWAPYRPDQVHLLYSLSKSFTATAAGFAAAEGLLSLNDTLLSHFPEFDDAAHHPWARSMTLQNLAAMATGHTEDTLERALKLGGPDPVRAFLTLAPEEEPGSVFAYNNTATYALGAVVQKVTGMSLVDYLRPRLLDPLGVADAYWDRDPLGRDIGFTGLHLTTESIAAFGQLYLEGGRTVLPEGWVAEASALHTPNPDEPNPDWRQGYGYQLWRSRHGYRGDGAYGQFCLILPEQDAVVVTTAQTENMQALLDLVWRELVPAFTEDGSTDQDETLIPRLGDLELQGSSGVPLPAPGRPDLVGGAQLAGPPIALDGGGWSVVVLEDEFALSVEVGDQAWLESAVDIGDGRWLGVAARGGQVDSAMFVVDLVFTQTPHRLSLTWDRDREATTSLWRTVPLRAPSILGLATDVAPVTG